jgi:murein DD-endopeptidase MepM/ murein hydrolase activator NlpD
MMSYEVDFGSAASVPSLCLLIVLLAAGSIASSGCSESPTEPERVRGADCLDLAVFGNPAESLYVLPFPVGESHVLRQGYCNPTNTHWYQFAYDFAMPIGSPIVAAREGTVVRVEERWPDTDSDPMHLNRVDIVHDDGTLALYAHLMENGVLVEVGDTVAQGQLIAQGGSSAVVIPLLHFQVYRTQNWRDELGADIPINFRNADGPLDHRNGLIQGATYTALPW